MPHIQEAFVDSGASTTIWTEDSGIASQLVGVAPSKAVFQGMENGRQIQGSIQGTACCYVFDPDDVMNGQAVKITGTIVPGARASLISVWEVVEQLGFTKVIRPTKEGESGFYKTLGDGSMRGPKR